MFLRFILFLTFVTTLIFGGESNNSETCGISPSLDRYKIYNPNRIFGGFEASEGDWPWIVRIVAQSDFSIMSCTGSIISNKWILTAAHCLENRFSVKVYYGSVNKDLQKAVTSENWIIHEDYVIEVKNDVALIELPEPLTFSKDVQPICLNGSIEPYENEILTAAGFGLDLKYLKCEDCVIEMKDMVTSSHQILQDTPLAYQIPEKCIYNEKVYTREDPFICTSGINHSPLPGDSGGPLMAIRENRWVQIGIFVEFFPSLIKAERISMKSIGINPRLDCKWIQENTNGEVTC